MGMHAREQWTWGAIIACALAAVLVWTPLLAHSRGVLTVHFLDVGQGDAIFIESPTGVQILIDGGRDRSVLRELGEVMPWYDRTIDVMIPTHPDADHIAGLIDVLDRFAVARVLESSVQGDTDLWRTLEDAIEAEGAERTTALRGQSIDLGGGARLDILFPDRDVPHIETNTGSIVARLVYGDIAFMLTGDSPQAIEKYLLSLQDNLKSDVLKAGHHGSKTSSSKEFVEAVHPRFAVFSRGCANSYGHPHAEVVTLFEELTIPVLDTCKKGRISFISDGLTVREE
ncbi:MAG: MBL fold metallo-hydrolase [Parcubacteria group bacterium]|nr:MBL fold metallo-hydrolase [Parcubacteria group bacterium]